MAMFGTRLNTNMRKMGNSAPKNVNNEELWPLKLMVKGWCDSEFIYKQNATKFYGIG